MNEQQIEGIKGLRLANEFLKIIRGYKKETERSNPIPDDVSQSLANAQLQLIMEQFNCEPDHLIWGLVQMLEMFLKMTDTEPETLASAIDQFLEFVDKQEGNPNV